MSHIFLEKITFGYGEQSFRDVSLTVGSHDRIGIVGNNGCGKSTLLRCMSGMLEPHAGKIIRQRGLKLGFLEQEMPKHLEEQSLYAVISDAIPGHEKDYSMWRVDAALDAFKATSCLRNRSMKNLSGAWKRIALIVRIVLSAPDLLLLDEPTNHLDVTKILLLEQWLTEQVVNIPLISVSHDRRFLENCTNKTWFLRGGKIHEYHYSYAHAFALLQEDDKTAASQRSKEVKELSRLKQSAHALRQIGVNNYSTAALKKSNQLAKRAEHIATQLTAVHVEEKRTLKLGNSGIQSKKLLDIERIDITSPDGHLLFHVQQFTIMQGERVMLFGENGSGKSQFLRFLYHAAKDLEAAKSQGIYIANAAKLGYIDQHLSHLPDNCALHDYLSSALTLGDQKTTSVLVDAGFPLPSHHIRLALLSPGQRARVAFLILHYNQPNFYIMDEPTNHLDLAGQKALESEILTHGATSVVVSHDRAFSKQIGTTYYMIEQQRLMQIDSGEAYYAAMIKMDKNI